MDQQEIDQRLEEFAEKQKIQADAKIKKADEEFPLQDRIFALEESKAEKRRQKELLELKEYEEEQQQEEDLAAPSKIDEAAYYGLAGELVKIIEPSSETDPIAILINFLTAFGSIVGENPYFEIESDAHRMRIFAVLVGDTAKARKGTSWGYIRHIFSNIDPLWEDQITTGLNSGEGLIWAVRDPIVKKDKHGNEVVIDEGVVDKRVLVIEPEFASTLRILGREGNTLSPNIRNAWDTGRLRSMTKNMPAKTTHSHISILAHITEDELIKYLDEVETTNGFGNRFLWFYVHRSKILPYGGKKDIMALEQFTIKLIDTISAASTIEKINFDPETYELWGKFYPKLTEPHEGIVGTMFARNEPYVLRLASLYALLDKSSVIRLSHLEAAVAIIDYVLASLQYIFRNSSGDSIGDDILAFLKDAPEGLTRTEIFNLFGKHKTSSQIKNAIIGLEQNGKVVAQKVPTGGREALKYTLNTLNTLNTHPLPKNYLNILRTMTKN